MFGHDALNYGNISHLLMADTHTFSAQSVASPCDADYLLSANGKRVWWKKENDDGHYFESKWSFGSASSAHSFMQGAGYGTKYASAEDYAALGDKYQCPPSTSGRSEVSWPYAQDAVIVVKYKNASKWGAFRPANATSRGLATGWTTGTETQALNKSYGGKKIKDQPYVILDAGICGMGSFAVNLTPGQILAEAQACATPSNCEVSAWSAWSSCSSNGSRTRTRTVTNPSLNGGVACPVLTESQSCANCKTSGWSSWSSCNCDGVKTRSKTVTQQPSNGGTACPSLSETGTCSPPDSCTPTTTTPPTTPIIPVEDSSKDCPSENREDGADATECGDCISGYTADATGVCIADVETDDATKEGTNWLLWGGVAIAGIVGFQMMG